MTEEIVSTVDNQLPPYVNLEQSRDEYENLRITNLVIDAVNNKKVSFLEVFVTDTAETIANLPAYGAFILCVQGSDTDMPCRIYGCCSNGTAGAVASIVTQGGVNDWAGTTLTVASVGSNFTIKHDRAGVSDKFYLTILGYF